MGELRRMLLANATEQASNTGGGEDLPTKLVFSDGPNEDNARIYEYLMTLHNNNIDGDVIYSIDVTASGVAIRVKSTVHSLSLLPSGSLPYSSSDGGAT